MSALSDVLTSILVIAIGINIWYLIYAIGEKKKNDDR